MVDQDGKSWYYSMVDGSFVGHIQDDDDRIYLVTTEQIENAIGNIHLLSNAREL